MTVNPALVRILGYRDRHELFQALTDPFNQLIVDTDKRDEILKQLKEQGFVRDFELGLRRKDGSIVHVSANVQTTFDRDGRVAYYQGIAHDITRWKEAEKKLELANIHLERRIDERTDELVQANVELQREIQERQVAENALRKSELKYRTILDNIHDAYYEVDLQGNLTFFNDALCRLSGFSREEVLGMNNRRFMTDDTARDIYRAFNRVYQTGGVDELFDYEVIVRGGRKKQISLSVALLKDEDGTPVGFHGIARDITIYKKVESHLKKAKEAAEAASAAKSDFLANMSHEIRTPMNGIIGMTGLLMETDLSAKQREYIDIIQNSAESLLDIINDILDISKIEAGKLSLEKIPFSLLSVVEEVAGFYMEKLKEKHIEFVVDVDLPLPESVSGDPLRLRQVLLNLISNAFKFTDGGEICLDVRRKRVQNKRVDLIFCVRDTGIGIPLQQQSRLFDVFAQADESTTRKYGGTGLGLTICKQLVELMGGDIWFESSSGKGSRFSFSLSFEILTAGETDDASTPFAGKHAVVIEDHPAAARSLKRMLTGMGFSVNHYGSALAAIHDLSAADADSVLADVIIADTTLPDASTSDLIRGLNPFLEDRNRKLVLMLTPDTQEKTSASRGLPVHTIEKPIRYSMLHTLLAMIFKVGEGRQEEREPGRDVTATGDLSHISLLLVEDNPVNQRVTAEIMRGVGARVVIAENGYQAIKLLRHSSFDIVLMDIQMPVMDGLEASRMIRQQLGMKDLPLVAMTARTMAGDRDICLDAGMNDYVSKPIDRRSLIDTVSRLVGATGHTPDAPEGKPVNDSEGGDRQEAPFPDAPGLNVQEGVSRIGNSLALYVDIVVEYIQHFEGFRERFTETIKDGRFDEAKRLAHTLKGAAGNISAETLHFQARDLESACQSGDAEGALHHVEKVDASLSQLAASADMLKARVQSSST